MSKEVRVIVCMPVYNEARTISEFIDDISAALFLVRLSFVVVNDCSTDSTGPVLDEISGDNAAVTIINNKSNLGHGRSTIIALQAACDLEPDYIVAADGDGNILGQDLNSLLKESIEGDFDVVEGVRLRPNDKWFRKIVSLFTRILVWHASGSIPADANTPFRVYKRDSLKILLTKVPKDSLVPNLIFSTNSRKFGMKVLEAQIVHKLRSGASEAGSTWNQKFSFLPSRRFLVFCVTAVRQWLKEGGKN